MTRGIATVAELGLDAVQLTRHASECYTWFAKIGKALRIGPCAALEVISPHLYFHEPFSVKELEVMYDRVCDGWQPGEFCEGTGKTKQRDG